MRKMWPMLLIVLTIVIGIGKADAIEVAASIDNIEAREQTINDRIEIAKSPIIIDEIANQRINIDDNIGAINAIENIDTNIAGAEIARISRIQNIRPEIIDSSIQAIEIQKSNSIIL